MHELKERDYGMVRSLFRELEHNLITRAVIERASLGRINVDCSAVPRTAFMCTQRAHFNLLHLMVLSTFCKTAENHNLLQSGRQENFAEVSVAIDRSISDMALVFRLFSS